MPEETGGQPDDAEILRRFRDGDETAFDGVLRRFQKDVYRLAYRLTGTHAEADDVAQETFVRAYGALAAFRGESTLRTWLLRIATNLSLNVVQSARVARQDAVDVEAAARTHGPSLAEPPEAEAALLREERHERLRPAIAALPPRQRATLLLRVEEGLKFKEIARMMGCTTGTAKANFFHAVAALKRALKDLA